MWVLVATILGSSMAFIDSTVVNVALPALQASFKANVVGLQWIVESYGLTLSALLLMGGSFGDLFGRRRVFLIGLAVFAAASGLCGFAQSISQLIAARAVQGVGAAFLVPGSLALISACFDESERGRAIGTWSGATAITTAIGPLLGGWVVQHLSWRWAFYINLPIAAAAIAITLWRVPESRSEHHGGIDWWGTLLATLGLTGVVFGSIEATRLGWGSPFVLGSLIGGLLCLIAFPFIEENSSSPIVPLTLFHSRAFSGANLLTLFLYAAIGYFFFVLPLNLIQVQHYSPTATGGATLPLILLMFFLSRWSGGLVHRYGPRRPLILGPIIVALGFCLFSVPSVGGSYWTTFFPAILVLGLGMAISVAPLTTVVMESVDQDRVGTASGINNAMSRVAGLLAIAIFGVLMVAVFSGYLNRRLTDLPISPDVRAELRSNETRMAALTVPAGVDRRTRAAIESSIVASFVFTFRLMMWICAGLALASAGVTWWMIPAGREVSGVADSGSAGS
jgi:EmrB/QacA subfamily drug resistance transporter